MHAACNTQLPVRCEVKGSSKVETVDTGEKDEGREGTGMCRERLGTGRDIKLKGRWCHPHKSQAMPHESV